MMQLYADGSSTGKVGEGGWGFVIVVEGKIVYESSGGDDNTTNNRMELLGIIEGLRYICQEYGSSTPLTVYSDSQYVVKGINEWFPKWQEKIATGKTIINQDLWLQYKELIDLFTIIELKWVRGHAGNVYNERCDVLAKAAKDQIRCTRESHVK